MINQMPAYKRIILVLFFLSVILNSKLALSGNTEEKSFKYYEDSLKYYFSLIVSERNDLEKEVLNDKALQCFRELLKLEDSFLFEFDSLNNIGVINAPDNKIRIITWNLPYNDGTHKYFGFIQFKKSKKTVTTYELNDNSNKINTPEFAILNHKNWYGALYYKIIVNKYKGNTYYTLLGADLNDILTKKKLIEILYFNRNDMPVFGKAVFKNRKLPVSRVIFEFNSQTNMVLTYDEEKQMIVYDHLSPSRPSLEGQYEFYGSDFSYDGLRFERGIWNTYLEIDVRNYEID